MSESDLLLSTPCLPPQLGHSSSVNCVAHLGDYILSGSNDKTVRCWNLFTSACTSIMTGHTGSVTSVAWHPSGRLALSASTDTSLRLWNVNSGDCLVKMNEHKGVIFGCTFSFAGLVAASCSADKTIRCWDVLSGTSIRVLQGHSGPVRVCRFMPKKNSWDLLISGSTDYTLRLWEVKSGNCLRVFHGHNSAVLSCAVSPDGLFMLSGSLMGRIKIWDISEGICLQDFGVYQNDNKKKGGAVNCIQMSSSGRSAVTCGVDHVIRLWNLSDSTCRLCLHGHTDTVLSCIIVSEKQLVISASQDGTIRLWQLRTAKQLQFFQKYITPSTKEESKEEKLMKLHSAFGGLLQNNWSDKELDENENEEGKLVVEELEKEEEVAVVEGEIVKVANSQHASIEKKKREKIEKEETALVQFSIAASSTTKITAGVLSEKDSSVPPLPKPQCLARALVVYRWNDVAKKRGGRLLKRELDERSKLETSEAYGTIAGMLVRLRTKFPSIQCAHAEAALAAKAALMYIGQAEGRQILPHMITWTPVTYTALGMSYTETANRRVSRTAFSHAIGAMRKGDLSKREIETLKWSGVAGVNGLRLKLGLAGLSNFPMSLNERDRLSKFIKYIVKKSLVEKKKKILEEECWQKWVVVEATVSRSVGYFTPTRSTGRNPLIPSQRLSNARFNNNNENNSNWLKDTGKLTPFDAGSIEFKRTNIIWWEKYYRQGLCRWLIEFFIDSGSVNNGVKTSQSFLVQPVLKAFAGREGLFLAMVHAKIGLFNNKKMYHVSRKNSNSKHTLSEEKVESKHLTEREEKHVELEEKVGVHKLLDNTKLKWPDHIQPCAILRELDMSAPPSFLVVGNFAWCPRMDLPDAIKGVVGEDFFSGCPAGKASGEYQQELERIIDHISIFLKGNKRCELNSFSEIEIEEWMCIPLKSFDKTVLHENEKLKKINSKNNVEKAEKEEKQSFANLSSLVHRLNKPVIRLRRRRVLRTRSGRKFSVGMPTKYTILDSSQKHKNKNASSIVRIYERSGNKNIEEIEVKSKSATRQIERFFENSLLQRKKEQSRKNVINATMKLKENSEMFREGPPYHHYQLPFDENERFENSRNSGSSADALKFSKTLFGEVDYGRAFIIKTDERPDTSYPPNMYSHQGFVGLVAADLDSSTAAFGQMSYRHIGGALRPICYRTFAKQTSSNADRERLHINLKNMRSLKVKTTAVGGNTARGSFRGSTNRRDTVRSTISATASARAAAPTVAEAAAAATMAACLSSEPDVEEMRILSNIASVQLKKTVVNDGQRRSTREMLIQSRTTSSSTRSNNDIAPQEQMFQPVPVESSEQNNDETNQERGGDEEEGDSDSSYEYNYYSDSGNEEGSGEVGDDANRRNGRNNRPTNETGDADDENNVPLVIEGARLLTRGRRRNLNVNDNNDNRRVTTIDTGIVDRHYRRRQSPSLFLQFNQRRRRSRRRRRERAHHARVARRTVAVAATNGSIVPRAYQKPRPYPVITVSEKETEDVDNEENVMEGQCGDFVLGTTNYSAINDDDFNDDDIEGKTEHSENDNDDNAIDLKESTNRNNAGDSYLCIREWKKCCINTDMINKLKLISAAAKKKAQKTNDLNEEDVSKKNKNTLQKMRQQQPKPLKKIHGALTASREKYLARSFARSMGIDELKEIRSFVSSKKSKELDRNREAIKSRFLILELNK
eukprot:g916.t1